ncbi:MAG: prepilin-type N-terminal cleavage/methylation domain-containing protein [Elusimicrobia bacterium]|nr:prepilin-type N-terminal cleavage/methylation domain-containing protein [Elusimicrobiota bacterium]
MKKIKNILGFTLVELIITIAIIVVLSMISGPLYKDYVTTAKLSEGYVLLAAIRDAQLQYYNEYGNFYTPYHKFGNGSYSKDDVLGIDARGNKYFTLFNAGYNHYGHGSGNDLQYFFQAQVNVPAGLGVVNNILFLQYNITLGSKTTSNIDTSWF